jgi:hypothetical protein
MFEKIGEGSVLEQSTLVEMSMVVVTELYTGS